GEALRGAQLALQARAEPVHQHGEGPGPGRGRVWDGHPERQPELARLLHLLELDAALGGELEWATERSARRRGRLVLPAAEPGLQQVPELLVWDDLAGEDEGGVLGPGDLGPPRVHLREP